MKQQGWWRLLTVAGYLKYDAKQQARTKTVEKNSLENLPTELSTLLSAPRPANEFANDLWARIGQAQSAQKLRPQTTFTLFHWTAAALTGTAATLLLYGFYFGRQPLSTTPAVLSAVANSKRIAASAGRVRETQTAHYSKMAAHTSHILSWGEPSMRQRKTRRVVPYPVIASVVPSANRQNAFSSLRKGLRHHSVFSHYRAEAARTLFAVKTSEKRFNRHLVFKAEQTKDWLSIGSQCESNADYAGAANAYRQAYRHEPNPNVAFAAGRMAEASGETPQALEDYANALQADAAVRTQSHVSVD